MRRKSLIVAVCLLGAGLLAFLATEQRRSRSPLLTIEETFFPSCETRTYTITQNALKISGRGGALHMVPSPALLRAINNAPLSALDALYEDPHMDDGFELKFQFQMPGQTKTVTVRNRYIPALYGILDECNKLLPLTNRFTEKQHFADMNGYLDRTIAEFRAKPDVSDELRAKVIIQLESRKVTFDE